MAKKVAAYALAASIVMALSACSGNPSSGSKEASPASEKKEQAVSASSPEQNPKPIELVFYGAGYSAEPFMYDHGEAIKAKFPHITVKFLRVETGKMGELIAAGTQLDVQLSVDFQMIQNMIDYGLQYDHAELIKTYKYDTSQLNPQMMEQLMMIGEGKLYGFPIYLTIPGLYYNKDLFDKFGVGYPKDGMTWDEVYELSKKMTRKEGGVSYRGMVVAFQALSVQNQLSLSYVDPKSNKAQFTASGSWQRHADNLTRFYKIPGNEVDEKTVTGASQNTFFFKDRVAAMFATVGSPSIFASNPAVNMDVATIPSFPELPGISGKPSATVFGVSALSKHKEEAFKVLMYLTSKEYQLEKAKRGVITVLSNDPDIRKAYGTEEASLKGKNIQALNPAKFASPGKASNYDHLALPNVLKYMNLVAQGNMDVNTALRSAAEETDKAIEELKVKQGK